MSTPPRTLRRGLPRIPGGQAWPELDGGVLDSHTAGTPEPVRDPVMATAPMAPGPEAPLMTKNTVPTGGVARADARQGLPRLPGGDPWPPKAAMSVPQSEPPVVPIPDSAPEPAPVQASDPSQVATAATFSTPASTSQRLAPLTPKQWALMGTVGAFAILGLVTTVVLLSRWAVGFPSVRSFLQAYPGEYHLPATAPVGLPAWIGWQHFCNVFLMVLIIRSGWQVRHQVKPPAYWASKRVPKISLTLWLHLSLDALWLLNGIVFVVLLFSTGQWMRIVPTSWEVLPNAMSAGLQYLTLDWPTENGWVNYNALQQLVYFTTVFIAAPLAAVTGVRMSAFWPKRATGLTRVYPLELARKLHFPIMLYFVAFIAAHVALVLSTGALRNLNHMYAAQGSTQPDEFAVNWTGLVMFAVSLMVIAAAWAFCRPMLLAPIARRFGTVSAR